MHRPRVGKTACSKPSTVSCSGTVEVACDVDGRTLRYDCATGPTMHRCAGGVCAPTGTACTLDLPETCQGSSVRYCQDGYLATVDCRALGFAGCAGGRCVPKAAGGTCPTGWTPCHGACVDLGSDPASCGSCGHACAAGETCQAGTCSDPGCRGSGCSPGSYCDQKTDTCKPGCLVDADCDVHQVCGPSQECTCATGAHLCGGVCVLAGDVFACGPSCTVCPTSANATATCQNGTCRLSCTGSFHWCGATCAANADPATCGSRCTPCPAPAANGTAACVSGACQVTCNPGYHASGTRCVADCQSDAACGAGRYCSGAGACEACPQGGNEVEPNDTQATAQPMPAGTGASTWTGQGAICPSADVDWWQVSFPSSGSASWSATVTAGAIGVAVYDGNKYLGYGSCDSGTPCPATRVSRTGANKPLYLEVQGSTTPATYTLTVTQP